MKYKENSKPIPITEELLLKFDFEIEEFSDFTLYSLSINDKYDTKISYFNETKEFDLGIDIPLNHIKYVHQLKNLYFALTGKELTSI